MKLFPTDKQESLRARIWRFGYNVLPAIRGTGSWLTFLSDDWYEAHLKLPLSLRTRNYVGTIFGGSLFSAADPMYMVMLFNILGPEYIVWDKSAKIRFIRPGKGTLRAHLALNTKTIEQIKTEVAEKHEADRTFTITWLNKDEKPVARIEKTVYIAEKGFYKQKRQAKTKMTSSS